MPPRTSHLARSLVLIYLGLTLGCVLTYWLLGGMSFFQALNHALTTVSTGGGYSTSDSSMGGQFDSPSILLASTVFMAMGAMPFFLFVRFIHGQRQPLLRDQQVRFFLRFLVIVAALLTIYRVLREPVDPFETFVTALFNVTSVVTTTGFASTDYFSVGGTLCGGGIPVHYLCRRVFRVHVRRHENLPVSAVHAVAQGAGTSFAAPSRGVCPQLQRAGDW